MAKCKRVDRNGTVIRRFLSGRSHTAQTSVSALTPSIGSIQLTEGPSKDSPKEPSSESNINWDTINNSPCKIYRNNAELLNLNMASFFLEADMSEEHDRGFMGKFTCNRWRQAKEIGVFKKDAISLEKTIKFKTRFATRRDDLRKLIVETNHDKKVMEPSSQQEILSDIERLRRANSGVRGGRRIRLRNNSGPTTAPSPLRQVQTLNLDTKEDSFVLPPIQRQSIFFGALLSESWADIMNAMENEASEDDKDDDKDDEKEADEEDSEADSEDEGLAMQKNTGNVVPILDSTTEKHKPKSKRLQSCPCCKHYGHSESEERRKKRDQTHARARMLLLQNLW